jgi:peptide-methionine (S)-S-oxide reductase
MSMSMHNTAPGTATETATLGGGCFWCLDAVYRDLNGVASVHSGYAGGHVENPSYEAVCGKKTGHAEVVQVEFDPAVVSFADLLRVFFTIHDPTTPNQQGNDIGPQYRSIILAHSPEQEATARAIMAEVTEQKLWPRPLVTELVPFTRYWPGEPEHQDYFRRTPWSGYCQAIIAPKVAKFRKLYLSRLKQASV